LRISKETNKSATLQELEILENFVAQNCVAEILESQNYISGRINLNLEKIKNTNEEFLSLRFNNLLQKFQDLRQEQLNYFDKVNLSLKLSESKNVHFMINDKFAAPTINFINKYFPKNDNLFLVLRFHQESYTGQKFPEDENVVEFIVYSLFNTKDFEYKKLIFHSFLDQYAVNFLYKNKNLLEFSYWMVWGMDLYDAPADEANTFVRKNIYGIGSVCDNNLIKQKYGLAHVFFYTNLAVAPVSLNLERAPRKMQNKNGRIVIQINNSADESTLEMLNILSKYKDENILIKTILSYGKVDLSESIINKGKEIFGDKFVFLDKIIPPDEYAEYLAENDVFILCQNRQQGLANLLTSLSLGVKIFVKYDVTTVKQFLQKTTLKPNFNFFNSNKIKDMDFREFCEISKEAIAGGIAFAKSLDDEENKVKIFSTVLDDYPINSDGTKKIKAKRAMLRFEVHICEHCNLNCKNCGHFSNIAEEKFIDLDILQRDFSRLSQLSNRKCENINLMGGEPLLHPKITEIFNIARKNFDTTIRLVTNGILLADQPDEFWESCNKNRITIVISAYPIKINEEKIKSQANKFGVKFELIRKSGENDWFRVAHDFTGSQNIETSYRRCEAGNVCLFLEDGKLATCGLPFFTKHFNKYFSGGEVKFDEPSNEDYVDIFKVNSLDEILEKFTRPIPYCRYCNPGGIKFGKWELSERKIEEWI